jgi:hypothetical protein
MKRKLFIIQDWAGNVCFDKAFRTYEDAWEFLYETYPVIYNADGSQDDRDDELGEYYVTNAYDYYSVERIKGKVYLNTLGLPSFTIKSC